MLGRLLVVVSLLGLSEQAYVMQDCGCGTIETYAQTTSAYCATTQYQSCNSSMLVDDSCTIACPYNRASVSYRNGTATWLSTKWIKCEDGVLSTAEGKKITMLMRPTCGFQAPCNNCPITHEDTTCPSGQTCNNDNYKRYLDEDDCDRVSCANSATLTLYDTNKDVIPFNTPKLYCTIANKWQNYSLNGGSGSNAVVPNATFSANCRLPASCETCLTPGYITDPTQMPEAFRTGYERMTPTMTKQTGQCATVTCPNAYLLMGFTAASQSGTEYTDKNFLLCASTSQWTNGGLGYTPQTMKYTCLQKILPCPPVENVLGNTFTVACDAQTKISTLVCPTAKPKLTMRYTTQTSTVKFDRATFFAGKGWLAHGCDSTAALFTTAAGAQINAVCTV